MLDELTNVFRTEEAMLPSVMLILNGFSCAGLMLARASG
jgi:hypothetical protein